VGVVLVLIVLASCSGEQAPVAEDRFAKLDQVYKRIESNVRANPEFELIVDIDHARLAEAAGSSMPPAHVLIFSDPQVDAALVQASSVAAVDLPLRVLAYEDPVGGKAMVIANSFDFVIQRHGLPDDEAVRQRYETALSTAMKGIPAESITRFGSDVMDKPGLVTLDSPFDFETTETRITGAITAQSDTVMFGVVDFAERAKARGVTVPPLRLLLFGGPGPGGKAMSEAPTLGLDAFCQKLVIWQDQRGKVHVTFNDLLALAERQKVGAGLPLRVINRRLEQTFTEALQE